MAFPTLETDAGATILRITDGTSGDPVTWDDVWNGLAPGGDGDVPKDGGGTIKVNTFMTEIVADAVYTIEKDIWFGNAGGDATYFQSKKEMIYFADSEYPTIKANATLVIGESSNTDYSKNGSKWRFSGHGSTAGFPEAGDLEIYGSIIEIDTAYLSMCTNFVGGDITIYQSIFIMNGFDAVVRAGCASLSFDGWYLSDLTTLDIRVVPALSVKLHLESTSGNGIVASNIGGAEVTLTGANITNFALRDVLASAAKLTMKDPLFNITAPRNVGATDWIREQYTCNIHVTDKDGVGLVGVNIECIEVGGAQEFSVNTDGAGDIAEQTVDYKQWAGTLETLTDYSPHQFILTKAGYKPLYLDNVTVDAPIVWELEMPEAVGAYAGAWK